ncbi:hypothetical protein [Nocardiopsis sp. FR4]|uniref:hypothetical protein n=1 Tax=Nocardiopsis sp. FR4 TaxID=2605985 RepID=UPI00135B2259|nr:hypothetical protein [Nocardiopsis sp. FR4]
MGKRFYLPGSSASADEWTAEADAIGLVRVDEASALPRPTNVGETYAEQEYRALGDEQLASWAAEGETAAREHLVQARGLDVQATAVERLLVHQEEDVRQAKADYQHAARVLTPYVRRETGNKLRYWIGWHALVLGDMAGVASAAIIHGDLPVLAVSMALASGIAAGSAGLVGSEVRHLRNARARQRDEGDLTDDEQRYARLFSGTRDKGLGYVGLVGVVSLIVVVLVAVGIFFLRGSVEGAAAGLTFGMLAAATALGSFLLGYSAADDVADVVSGYKKRAHEAERHFRKLAKDVSLKERAEAAETARSTYAEHQARGQAAAHRMASLRHRIQRNNTGVLGHGLPSGESALGRRWRPEANGHIQEMPR